MAEKLTTAGMLMVNQILPPELRSDSTRIDKKSIGKIMEQVAINYPDKYSEILQSLTKLGAKVAHDTGSSVSAMAIANTKERQALADELDDAVQELRHTVKDPKEFEQQVVVLASKYHDQFKKLALDSGLALGDPMAEQVASGARGNPVQYSSIKGADVLVTDHNGRPVPLPITRNYTMGLSPAQYFASLYGTRKGLIDTKMAVGDAGYLAKRLVNSLHRLVVTDEKPIQYRLPTGLPVDAKDQSIIGSTLAQDVNQFPAGTVITPKIQQDLAASKTRILVHSPITSMTEGGGVDRLSAGMRERGSLAMIGDNVGVSAAQAISEPISQGLLDSKHSAGVGSRKVALGGYEYINNLIEAPEAFQQTGPLARQDGHVDKIVPAPQGGNYVYINGEEHFVPVQHNVLVKPGQQVEAGDDLSDGIPHPEELVRLRGLGEARRNYYSIFKAALDNSGIATSPRNIEMAVTGLMNHAQVSDPYGMGDYIPDDVINYSRVFAKYKPRAGHEIKPVKASYGNFLEEPALHYTIGTRINSKVQKDLDEFGVKDVAVHKDPPQFTPFMQRSLLAIDGDEDWQTRLGGFYTARGFLDSVSRGAMSERHSTSYVPAVANPVEIGKNLKTTGRY